MPPNDRAERGWLPTWHTTFLPTQSVELPLLLRSSFSTLSCAPDSQLRKYTTIANDTQLEITTAYRNPDIETTPLVVLQGGPLGATRGNDRIRREAGSAAACQV